MVVYDRCCFQLNAVCSILLVYESICSFVFIFVYPTFYCFLIRSHPSGCFCDAYSVS